MNKFKRRFVDGDYGQIHLRSVYPQAPSKRPLVCLHMLPQSGRNYQAFLNHADDERIIIAPDFPGYGESDSPPQAITAAEYAASIWQLIDKLALLESHAAVDLFGIHAGAKLAAELARQRPDDVHKIIMSSAAVLYPQEIQHLKNVFHPVELDEPGTRFQNLWSMLVRNQGQGQTLEMMATGFAEMLRGGENYEWAHHAVYDFNQVFPEVLRSLPHRIELLNPKDDLYELTPRTVPYLQNGCLHDMPQWGQGFFEVNAAELMQKVCALLDSE